jgi:hypothetical protein
VHRCIITIPRSKDEKDEDSLLFGPNRGGFLVPKDFSSRVETAFEALFCNQGGKPTTLEFERECGVLRVISRSQGNRICFLIPGNSSSHDKTVFPARFATKEASLRLGSLSGNVGLRMQCRRFIDMINDFWDLESQYSMLGACVRNALPQDNLRPASSAQQALAIIVRRRTRCESGTFEEEK